MSQTLPRQAFLRRVAEDPEQDQGQQQQQPPAPHQQQMQGQQQQGQSGLPRVQAMYAHTGSGETQLSFNEVNFERKKSSVLCKRSCWLHNRSLSNS